MRDDSDDSALKLECKAEAVDLNRLGVDTTYEVPLVNDMEIYTKQGLFVKNNYPYIKKLLVGQAFLDDLSNTEEGLSVRWLMPDLDFADSYYEPIRQREWWVPANGRYFEPDPLWSPARPLDPKYGDNPTQAEIDKYQAYLAVHADYAKEIDNKIRAENPPSRWRRQTVFETNMSVARNDRKAIILFAIGLGHTGESNHIITSVLIKRHGSTRMIISTDQIPDGKAVAFEQPFIAKRTDNFEIVVTLPEDGWQGRRDKLILYGFVAEPIGMNQMG